MAINFAEEAIEIWNHNGIPCAIVLGPHGANGYCRIPEADRYFTTDCIKIHGGIDYDDGEWIGFSTCQYKDFWEKESTIELLSKAILDKKISLEDYEKLLERSAHSRKFVMEHFKDHPENASGWTTDKLIAEVNRLANDIVGLQKLIGDSEGLTCTRSVTFLLAEFTHPDGRKFFGMKGKQVHDSLEHAFEHFVSEFMREFEAEIGKEE